MHSNQLSISKWMKGRRVEGLALTGDDFGKRVYQVCGSEIPHWGQGSHHRQGFQRETVVSE